MATSKQSTWVSAQRARLTARPKRKRRGGLSGVVLVAMIGFGVPMLVMNGTVPRALTDLLARVESASLGSPTAMPTAMPTATLASARFALCSGAVRVTCVVDGDTIWLDGTKIRIADLNTPEIGQPECAAEAALGEQATQRLMGILNAGPFEVRPDGTRDEDLYGRKLRTIHRDGQSISDIMVAEGLAHRWQGYRQGWC